MYVGEYVGRLSAPFNLEIQSNHFGNDGSLSLEGCNIEFIDEDRNAQSEFYSNLTYDNRQDTSITRAYLMYMLEELEKRNKMNINCTNLEIIDCYYNKISFWYIVVSSFFISSNSNITIDRIIGVPGPVKYIMNVINICDKRYLREKCAWLGSRKWMIALKECKLIP